MGNMEDRYNDLCVQEKRPYIDYRIILGCTKVNNNVFGRSGVLYEQVHFCYGRSCFQLG